MGTVIGLAAAGVVAYLVACTVWPYASCSRCDGAGKFRSPSGKAWRPCGKCDGSGRKVRLGRRLFPGGKS